MNERAALAVERSDEVFTAWMRGNLQRAAGRFGVRPIGAPVFGWRLRSIGARAEGVNGECWLRVVSEYPDYAHDDPWTGNENANVIPLAVKPRVVDVWQWESDGRVQRAEVATVLPGEPVSVSDVLTADPRLPDRWWERLRDSLATLRTVPTRRINHDQASVSRRAQALLGQPVRVERWETVHGDLHWGNLMRPFGMLDWELWGRGPAGTDAATLFLYALPVPAVAVRVRAVFTDVLDTPVGRVAELVVAARMLARIAGGDYPHMAEPLRHHLKGLGVDLYR